MKILTILLAALMTAGCVASSAQQIESVGGGSTSIILEPSPVPPVTTGSGSAATLGDLIGRTRMQEQQSKVMIRVADCNERAQFAGFMVQVRNALLAEGKDTTDMADTVTEALAEGNKVYKAANGKDMPAWYNLEFHRVINDMNRMEPTDPRVFASWVGGQCVQFGPWLMPEAQ